MLYRVEAAPDSPAGLLLPPSKIMYAPAHPRTRESTAFVPPPSHRTAPAEYQLDRLVAFFPDSGPPEVWVVTGDGSDPRYLAAGYEPIWSPDGSMIIVRRDGERSGWTDLYAVLLPGGQVEQATFRGWAGNDFWLEAGRLAVHDSAEFAYWTMRWEPYEGFSSDSEAALLVDVVGEAHRAGDRLFYAAANEASPQYGAPRVAVADLTGSETMRVTW